MSAGSDWQDPPECWSCRSADHDGCSDFECPCDRAEHVNRPEPPE